MKDGNRYWFPAKRYGWGWGLPLTWQGWCVMIVWFAALLLGMKYLVPQHVVAFLIFSLIMAGTLLLICYIKGEPPSWRWGDDS